MFPGISIDLVLTVSGLVTALSGIVGLIWLEHRPRDPGKPLLLPTTPLLFFCLLAIVLILAHLLTIVTGTPFKGRMG